MRRLIAPYLFVIFMAMVFSASAEKLIVVYTGNTYASLYPCGSCSAHIGGGITRRSYIIKKLRSTFNNVLVVDGGNFTAGGVFDSESINASIDKKRTLYYIDAIRTIGYDALGVGEAEFNFGVGFLRDIIKKKNLPLVSCNMPLKGVSPYIIKEFDKIKVGIIGLTDTSVLQKNNISVKNYKEALKDTVEYVKGKADFIILLSSMPDSINEEIAKSLSGISFIISCGISPLTYKKKEVNGVLMLKPSYEAKKLNILELEIENHHIKKYSLREESLSLKVKEDPVVKRMIPKCFSHHDCSYREGLVSQCEDPATLKARCVYVEAKEFEAKVITDKHCSFCITTLTEKYIKKLFAGAHFKVVDYRSKDAQNFIEKYRINSLPAFILPKTIEDSPYFSKISGFLKDIGDWFIVNKNLSGVFLFVNRKVLPNTIDIFIDIYDPNIFHNFKTIVDFCNKRKVKLNIHFIYPLSKTDTFRKSFVAEEIKRMLAVKYLYPKKFIPYLLKRFEKVDSSWWINTMDEFGIDYRKIKEVIARGKIDKIIHEDYDLSKTLGITTGPVILVNNRYIFRIYRIKKENLEEIIKYN